MFRAVHTELLSRFAFVYEPTVRLIGFPALWQAVAEAAQPRRGEWGLDVCTGTGGAARELSRRGVRVVGLDLAHGMLRRAVRKHGSTGEAPAVFARMDARCLAIPDRSFPIVTCVMGLHEMAALEREVALGEIARVASDRVVVAEYRVPGEPIGRLLMKAIGFFEYFESDDFAAFLRFDLPGFLTRSGLAVGSPQDLGLYRVWPCRVRR
jgi:ubiquinone/menaquinone biosynthesis C-methylase UbiE